MNDNPLLKSLKELCLFFENGEMDYMLVGGVAVGIWGEPRATVDLDFLVSVSIDSFDLLKEKLRESNRFVFIHEQPMVFEKVALLRATLKSNPDISVDFLFADSVFKKEALKRKLTVSVMGFPVHIAAPEDLILLKLLSGRPQDRLDAKRILEIQKGNLDHAYLKKWKDHLLPETSFPDLDEFL